MTISRTLTAAAVTLALAACAGGDAPPAEEAVVDSAAAVTPAPAPAGDEFTAPDTTQMQRSATGLFMQDLHEGEGPAVAAGQTAVVHYTGWLMDGTKFDSSRDRGEPFPVENVGQAGVIAGWNEGLQGMKQGGHRVLVIPPGLGYGEAGFGGGVIPPNAWLVFKVELVEVR